MIAGTFKDIVNVVRRPASPPVDVLNNPAYGAPTTWSTVYANIAVRLAWSGKAMSIKSTGELIYPTGTLYYPKHIILQPMDRIITVTTPGIPKGIEYFIEAVWPSYVLHGVVDHYEASVHLPV